jgi:hypothetical protein
VNLIRDNLKPSCIQPESTCDCRLDVFDPVSYEEAFRVLKNFKPKTCSLDPIPTWIVKRLPGIFVPILCKIANASLGTGSFPSSEKGAVITPVFKKGSADREDFANYRPVSCLSFLSKFIEKLVYLRFNNYFCLNSLMPPMQSAYRQGYSTETAICKLLNDLLVSSDLGQPSVVMSLDLSAAFDTVDHDILISRLSQSFGFSGTVLSWLSSYLAGRTQRVKVGSSLSGISPLSIGVPQGSVLGPLLFTVYTAPLSNVINLYGLNFVTYADDITIYCPISCNLSCVSECLDLTSCLSHIEDWFAANRLKMNPSKTQFFVCGPNAFSFRPSIHIFNSVIPLSDIVNVLGVRFDSGLFMTSYVSKIRRTAFSCIRSIYRIRRFLTERSARLLFFSLILPIVDYCNVSLTCVKKKLLKLLQSILHCGVRFIFRLSRYDHITPFMKRLRCLPISSRISLRLCILVHKCLYGNAPGYLKRLLSPASSTSSRSLRSTGTNFLFQPRCRRVRSGAFQFEAPRCWNALPRELRQTADFRTFKRLLRSHLFDLAFP